MSSISLVLYRAINGTVAHECIVGTRVVKGASGVEVEDIAKRLMDYGFHAPTVSFPVAGTLMIEPTESESLAELDRFCDAMISIREEIREIEIGTADKQDNVLKNASHTLERVTATAWTYGYTREQAAFPAEWIRGKKVLAGGGEGGECVRGSEPGVLVFADGCVCGCAAGGLRHSAAGGAKRGKRLRGLATALRTGCAEICSGLLAAYFRSPA
ncbi:MAG: hypothetical protein WEA80_04495 [Gemmatimonadaceae bacterium]